MKNYIQEGKTLSISAPDDVVSGAIVNIGAIIGVALAAAARGASVEVTVEGVFNLPSNSGMTFSTGSVAYWDTNALEIVSAPGVGNIPVGIFPDYAENVSEVAVKLLPALLAYEMHSNT